MKPFHVFLMIMTAAAWGMNFVATRIVLEAFNPQQLSFARAVLTLTLLLPWWQPWRMVSVKFLVACIAIGVVSFYAMYEAIVLTQSLTSVAIGTQLMAPISAIIALLFYHQEISRRKWLGIGIATIGAMVLTAASGFGVSAWALGLTLLSVTFYSWGSIVVSKTGAIGIWRLLAWISAVSIIPLGLLASASGPLIPDPASLGLAHWLALLYAVVISALLGQAVLFSLYRIYPVAEVSPYMLFIPIFAGLFSKLVFDEHISLGLVLGGGVILFGVWVQQTRSKTAPVV